MISIKGLSFSFFNTEKKVLDSIDLDIPGGQFLAITGPSGCGKSTLALAIGGYIPHVFEGKMSGTVKVEGDITTDLTLNDLATRVGIVQQDPESQLCTLNVKDEVCFGPENLVLPPGEVGRRLEESLSMVGASHLIDRQVYELSGGEKQKVAIASILAMHPRTIILDEPTSNLDPTSTSEVLATIQELKKKTGLTIIVIEHKLDMVMSMADRLLVMDKGKIALDGKPAEVIERYRDEVKKIGVRLPFRNKFSHTDHTHGNGEPIVKAEDLRFSYDHKEILHGIDFEARHSEIIGLIGPNGSGKTTFLLHLMGLNHPRSGKISVMGIDVTKAKTSGMARKVGYVFQNPNSQIFERTVFDEAAFGCRNLKFDNEYIDTTISSMLEKYGLSKYRDRHPHGISFGEKRRLNLCSILPHGPDVIVLDEPFVGQDFINVSRMIEHINELKKEGKTVILVSHDVDLVYKHCDRVVLFKSGNIAVDDEPEEAFRKISEMGMKDYLPGAWS
ncbi:heme ABC transporter ATP-binding protein [Methanocella sp. CWC-04]|uniref:Heme ABC transporter ATP-binding protein n=1 Tax=Methanooceanicella nereidis TaxID=2052831 RepID=A0AAP2RAL7_9EURY|nr:energy-coupling factor transporter ATPase [Methanocella sp. CWC-04]MCD1294031.1 heme ABC transporter ATP-binding protein [Methanocella sp. CWC-04]